MKLLPAARPSIRVYKPQRRDDDTWLLRADIEVAGERIELQANATSRLTDRARNWYNAMAARFAAALGYDDQGAGVFADVPQVASSMGYRPVVPRHDDVSAAAKLYFAGGTGDARAEQEIETIYQTAWRDPAAQQMLDNLMLIESAMFERERLPMRQLMIDAAQGSPHAHKVLAALYQVGEAPDEPTRLSWWVDDYVYAPDRMLRDVTLAAGDEVYARLVTPKLTSPVRRVSPGTPVMARTWDQIMVRGY